MPPGHRQWLAGQVVSEGLRWEERVNRQLAALKEQIGFAPGDIAVRKFESEEVGIYDLPGDYVQFLENRATYSEEDQKAFDEYIEKWRHSNCFVLDLTVEHWMSAEGEVESS